MLSNFLVLIIFKNKWLTCWMLACIKFIPMNCCTFGRSPVHFQIIEIYLKQSFPGSDPEIIFTNPFFLLYFICIFLPYHIHFCIGFMHLFGKGIILLSIAIAGSGWLMSTRLTKVYKDMKGNTDLNWFVWTCWIFIHSSEDTDDHVTKTLRRIFATCTKTKMHSIDICSWNVKLHVKFHSFVTCRRIVYKYCFSLRMNLQNI